MHSEAFNLGRILVKLEHLSEDEIFEHSNGRPKDFMIWWNSINEQEKEDYVRSNAYHLQDIYERICECVIIARGHNDLNSIDN